MHLEGCSPPNSAVASFNRWTSVVNASFKAVPLNHKEEKLQRIQMQHKSVKFSENRASERKLTKLKDAYQCFLSKSTNSTGLVIFNVQYSRQRLKIKDAHRKQI
jgi:hypothetical protein